MAGQAKIKTIKLTIQGLDDSPLKMNPMPKDQLLAMRAGIKEVRNREESVEAEAKRKLYRSEDYAEKPGIFGIPRVNLFACLCKAGPFFAMKGKTNISTATSTFLPMIVSFEEGRRFFAFDDQNLRYEDDVVKGTNPNGGEAVVIVRPAYTSWRITLTIKVNEATGVSDRTIYRLFKLAGEGIGLCDHRPSKGKGECGRFKVVEWDLIEEHDIADEEAKFFDKGKRKKVTRRDQIIREAETADHRQDDEVTAELEQHVDEVIGEE